MIMNKTAIKIIISLVALGLMIGSFLYIKKQEKAKQEGTLTVVLVDETGTKKRQRLTLPGFIPVPSALVGLTALFGMGRGDPHRHSHLKVL